MTGWQDYVITDTGERAMQVLPDGISPGIAIGILGVTGMTAYFGVIDVGQVKDGDVVVVSGAAGATGSAAGQIAKIKGAKKVVGIAGGAEKCAYIVDELGFDEAIDYKNENVAARLRETCPDGIDLYFDNVGGSILNDCLANLAMRGRVVLCGAISTYNSDGPPPGRAIPRTCWCGAGAWRASSSSTTSTASQPRRWRWPAGSPRARSSRPSTSSRAWRRRLTRSTCCSAAATPAK